MTKNITVVDGQGNEYGATWPKRAKGLVKHGRARFVDENKICLACPPDILKTEDIEMSENIKLFETAPEANETEASTPSYTLEYILAQIEEIRKSDENLREALTTLAAVDLGDACEYTADTVANITGMVCQREETNQKMLSIYMAMLNDLRPKKVSPFEKLREITDFARSLDEDDFAPDVWEQLMARISLQLTSIPIE